MSEITAKQLENFERAFSGNVAGPVRDCVCGTVFYDSYNSGYDWEDGEFERLQANEKAKPLGYAVGTLEFEGRVYVPDCDCWKKRAKAIIAFILNHDHEIAEFLRAEKKRKQQEADNSPLVDS